MERIEVKSRGIRWIRYDEVSRTLDVAYISSGEYRYFGVEREVYDWLARVKSKGRFVNRLVKGKYRYERLDAKPQPAEAADLAQLLQASLRLPPKDGK